MADATPWQVASAGQKIPVKPDVRVVFTHGTEPWPYAPHYVLVTANGTEVAPQHGVYGVNTHQS